MTWNMILLKLDNQYVELRLIQYQVIKKRDEFLRFKCSDLFFSDLGYANFLTCKDKTKVLVRIVVVLRIL